MGGELPSAENHSSNLRSAIPHGASVNFEVCFVLTLLLLIGIECKHFSVPCRKGVWGSTFSKASSPVGKESDLREMKNGLEKRLQEDLCPQTGNQWGKERCE